MSCTLPRHDKENRAPHPNRVGVNISSDKEQSKKSRRFTLGEKNRTLTFMDQSLKMGKVSELTGMRVRSLRRMKNARHDINPKLEDEPDEPDAGTSERWKSPVYPEVRKKLDLFRTCIVVDPAS